MSSGIPGKRPPTRVDVRMYPRTLGHGPTPSHGREPLQWQGVHGVRFFRWKGSKHYPEGPRLMRTAEPHEYTGLAPCGPAFSANGKTWVAAATSLNPVFRE